MSVMDFNEWVMQPTRWAQRTASIGVGGTMLLTAVIIYATTGYIIGTLLFVAFTTGVVLVVHTFIGAIVYRHMLTDYRKMRRQKPIEKPTEPFAQPIRKMQQTAPNRIVVETISTFMTMGGSHAEWDALHKALKNNRWKLTRDAIAIKVNGQPLFKDLTKRYRTTTQFKLIKAAFDEWMDEDGYINDNGQRLFGGRK